MLNKPKRVLHLGDIVAVKPSILGEPQGILAYVYEEYDIGEGPGVSIISRNGVDMGGFSPEEQPKFLHFVRSSGYNYNFRNVNQLDNDFPKLIKPLFDDINIIFTDPDILTDKKQKSWQNS